MKKQTILNTQILQEGGEALYKKWFSQSKSKQFITHPDTIYFMITPDITGMDYVNNEPWQKFTAYLKQRKDKADLIRDNIPVFADVYADLEVVPYKGAQMYGLHFGIEDRFDVFVCPHVPNEKTPPIQVQLRSNFLWIGGMRNAFDEAYFCVRQVLKSYGLEIKEVQENRIDYAFHTNYINDLMNFFPENDLKKMQVSNFTRAEKQYDLQTFGDDEDITSDYLLIGRKKSNNALFVAYNKTKEVIEQGYKQFFIQIWKDYNLINDFDVWILERAFNKGSYESKDMFRCEFYFTYGTDDEIRKEIGEKLNNPDTPAKYWKKRAKGLVPDITIITNIEIRTKHKLYGRLNIPMLTTEQSPKKNIYNIFEQMSEIIRFITEDTIRFVKYKGEHADTERHKRPMADWWQRLRNAKMVEITDLWVIDYIRHYEHTLNLERQKSLTISKMAGTGAYLNVSKTTLSTPRGKECAEDPKEDLAHDWKIFLENLNDNDFRKYRLTKKKRMKDILRRYD